MKPGNSIFKNATWNILSTICNLLMVFFCTPLIIRNLGATNYGIYIILGTIGGILSVASLGMGEATLKYVAQYSAENNRPEVRKVFTSTFTIYAALGGVITVFLWIFPEFFIRLLKIDKAEEAIWLFRATALTFWIHLVGGCFTAIPKAAQRYEFCTYVSIVQNLLQLFAVFLVVRLGYGIRGLIYATLLNAIVIVVINWMIAKCLLPYLGFSWPGIQGFKKVINYGVMIFGSQIVGLLWQYSDNIILSAFIGPQAVSYFSVPMQTVGKGFGLINSGTAVLFPHFSALSSDYGKNEEKIKEVYIKATQIGLLSSIIMCVPLAVMLPDFLRLWISEDFARQSSFIATILAASYIIRGAFLPYDSLFKGLGYPKYIFIITLASSLCIFIFDLVAIPLFGINGVGLSYVISSLVGVAAIIFIFKKILFIPMTIFWRDLASLYFTGVAFFFALLFFRGHDFWPHGNWGSFILMSAAVFVINIITIICSSKLFNTRLYFKSRLQ